MTTKAASPSVKDLWMRCPMLASKREPSRAITRWLACRSEHVPLVFTPNFLRCLSNNLTKPDSHLHSAAKKCLERITAFAGVRVNRVECVRPAFVTPKQQCPLMLAQL
jgi:hypothetical protein